MTGATKLIAAASGVALAGAAAFTGVQLWKAKTAPVEDASPATVAMVTNWRVFYYDAVRGTVEGKAVVDWEKSSATVTFDVPASGDKVILKADDVTIDKTNTTVTMRLRTSSFEGTRVEAPSTDGMKRVAAAQGQQLAVTPAEPSFSTPVKDKAQPDHDGVRLVLRAGAFGALSGEWSYLADPITKRNSQGSGRSGYFRLLNEDEIEEVIEDKSKGFIGLQTGSEDWWPLPTEIACTVVMEEQLAAKNRLAEYFYPFSGGSGANDPKQTTRTLFVVGRNFPVDRGRVLKPIDPSNNEKYRIVALSTDPNLDAKGKERIDDGWKKVTQLLDDDVKQLARDTLDAAVIVVEMKQGIMPSPRHIGWGEGEGTWFLQFGDNVAQARFVRPVKIKTANDQVSTDEFEQTPWIFLPEKIAVEVETRATLPLDVLPVRIASKAAIGKPVTMPAKRVAGRAILYRTELFTIAKGGGSGPSTIALSAGDELMATVQVDDVAFIAPPLAQARVLLTPDQLAQSAQTTQGDSTKVKLWKEALSLAAKANNVSVTDFSALSGHGLDPYKGIPMTVGDYAAMLLLRSAFLDMMREQLQYLDSIKSDDDIEAFREWLRPFMEDRGPMVASEDPPVGWEKYPDYLKTIDEINKWRQFLLSLPFMAVKTAVQALDTRQWGAAFGKGTYFGELPVPNPAGRSSWPYFTTYAEDRDTVFDRFFPDSRHIRMRDWRLKATRAVLAQYREAVAKTIATVAAIRDSNKKELLKLTGLSFGAVVSRVIPQLMRLDDSSGSQRWVTDSPARGAVAHLHVFGAAVRASEDYSDAKDRAVLEIASALLTWGAPGLVFGEATGLAFSRVAGWGLLAWQAGNEIYDQVVLRSDIDLFFGASVVLGTDRLEESNARKASIGDVVLQLATRFAISHVWGEIEDRTSPITVPPHGALRGIFRLSQVAFAATPLPPTRRLPRILGFAQRVRDGLGRVSAERMIGRFSRLTVAELKQWPKQQLQRFLQLAARGGARIERDQPARLEEVQAAAEARRLNKGEAAKPGKDAFGAPPANPKAPDGGKKGFPGLGAAPAQAAIHEGPYIAAGARGGRDLPLASEPPMDKSWIAIREKEGGWVYYKTHGLDEKGGPKALAGGEGTASSDVYTIANVDSRAREIRDRKGAVVKLEGEAAVIKIVKDNEEAGFGLARDQIRRMRQSYNELVAAQKRDPTIEFAEVLEWHEDANPPYLIQRRINFDNQNYSRVKPWEGRLLLKEIEKRFEIGKRRAVVELYFRLAAHDLISPDLSLPNLYFKKVGGKWVAGILDIDHIMNFRKPGPKDHVTWDWIRNIRDGKTKDGRLPSTVVDGRQLHDSPFTFMEKMFELRYGGHWNQPWIEYRPGADKFIGVLIEPELIERVFRDFKLRPRQPPKKQVWLDRLNSFVALLEPSPLPAVG